MQLRTPGDQILNLTILQVFPFTYESKRMGIIVRVSGVLPCPSVFPLPLIDLLPLSILSCPPPPSILPCPEEYASGILTPCWGLITVTQTSEGV